MKKPLFPVLAALCLMFLLPVGCRADGRMIEPEMLPEAAKTFIKQYFPENTIIYAEKEVEIKGTTYEVRLDDGTKVDFDGKGIWDKVNCKIKAVPAALVPEPIAAYVNASFTGQQIVKIDKERYGYEIELSCDLDLKFNKQGKLIRVDD